MGKPLKVVEHIGCHYSKMFPSKGFGGAEYPHVLVGMIEAWGGEVVDYPERRHCCGFGFRQYFVQANRGYSESNTHKKFESMEPYEPDLIITNCPGCPYFLDRWQYVIAEQTGKTYGKNGYGIPALTYEEVAARCTRSPSSRCSRRWASLTTRRRNIRASTARTWVSRCVRRVSNQFEKMSK